MGQSFSKFGNSPESMSSECPAITGFYRVVRMGAQFYGLTNGTPVSGEMELLLEVGSDDNELPEIMFHVNGVFQAASEVVTNQQGFLALKWDTRFVGNGTRNIDLAMVRDGA